MKKVLIVASECVPFIKTGGLADVIGALPKKLALKKYDVRVILPLYQKVIDHYIHLLEKFETVSIHSGNIHQPASYYRYVKDNVTYYFVEHQGYFEREGLYGFEDDAERFSFFQRAALDLLAVIDWFPDVIHTHDWHTGMIPLMTKVLYDDERYRQLKHVFTIHNLAFQGNFDKFVLSEKLGIPMQYYENGNTRFHEGISFMKTAIVFADKITTVSYTYSREILTDEFGENLQYVLQYRQDDLWGIVNGIDTVVWNPKTDQNIAYPYGISSVEKAKIKNKLALQSELGLVQDENVMLIGMVTRLSWQKGCYLLLEQMSNIMQLPIQLVILGSGEKDIENSLKYVEYAHKGKAVFYCGYDEQLAHRIYAATDLFLMPSLYEPCGIGQLIAMHYGSLPLVRETGGLKDTVQPYNEYTKEGTGFGFNSKNSWDLFHVLKYAVSQYYEHRLDFEKIRKQAMQQKVDLDETVSLYEKLYCSIE